MWDTGPQGNARYWCRVCNKKGWADKKLSADEVAEAQERYRKQQEAREMERQEWIKQLQEEAYWRGWHDAMTANARRLWRERGLVDQAQDYLELGYTEEPPRGAGAALTIPYHNLDWDVVNLQWRYIEPAPGRGKYNQPKGQPLPVYHADPTSTSKNLLIVEGAIKTAVTWWEMAVRADMDYRVVGVPASTPSAEVMTSVCSLPHTNVYIMTDPDTYEGKNPPAYRIGEWFDEPLYVKLPGKPDDLINSGWTAYDLEAFINSATLL